MSFHSFLVGKNTGSQRNIWLLGGVIGIAVGAASLGMGFWLLKNKPSLPYIIAALFLALITGGAFGFIGREIMRGIVNFISEDFVSKLGLKSSNFESTKTGFGRDIELFAQMFKLVLSVLKRVLLISFKLEEASSDLDKTANLASQVIKEIVDSVGAINDKAGSNAANLKETISSLERSFGLSKDISSKLIIAKEDSQSVSEISSKTQVSVKEAVQKMLKIKELTDGSATLVSDLNNKSKQIGTILTEIASIAEKTNLLALNAAIEAARAGEQGLGFAVVADEVRKLARGSADSSKKINNLINDILQKTENAAEMMQNNTIQVNEGMNVISGVETNLGSMVQTSIQLNDIIKDISLTAESQTEASDVVYQKVDTISKITYEISAQIQDVSAVAQSRTVIVDQTSSYAKELRSLSDVFQNALVPFDFHIEGANKRSAIRAETRIPCKFKVVLSGTMTDNTFVASDLELRGVITNLSAGGCVVETREDVEQGKYIVLAFQIGSNFIQSIQGRLVRVRKRGVAEAASDDFVLETEAGVNECIVSFSNVSSENERLIVDFVMNAQRQFEINLGLTE